MSGLYWTDRAKITLKTHLVLELVDNFRNQLLLPCRMQYLIDGKLAKATRNKNGLLVFCNLLDVPTTITIKSDLYQERSLVFSEEEQNQIRSGSYLHRQVRLEPSKTYNIPSWGTVIEGQVSNIGALGNTPMLECVIEDVVDRYRVKKINPSKNEVTVHLSNQDLMVGRTFYDADGHLSEAFVITEVEGEVFKAEPQVSETLEAHSVLQEVKSIYIGADGRFMIVYPKVTDKEVAFKLYNNKQKVGEFQIKSNTWNDLGVFNI